METQIGQGEKNSCSKTERILAPKLNATASTLPGPPRPGPGYDVPPEPPLVGPAHSLTSILIPGQTKRRKSKSNVGLTLGWLRLCNLSKTTRRNLKGTTGLTVDLESSHHSKSFGWSGKAY